MITLSENFTLYVIMLDKVDERPLSSEVIGRHIEHLRSLHKDGDLVLCGPFTDCPSGMVVIRAKSKEDAVAIARRDPFVQEGVRTFDVRTWLIACEENQFLG